MNLITAQGKNFKVRLEAENFDPEDMDKLASSVIHMAEALGSDQFKEFVENYFYDETSCTGRLWWKKCSHVRRMNMRFNNGFTQSQIYEKLMSGKEDLRPESDNEADITLHLDKRNRRGVLGYTYANTTSQWVYNWFFTEGELEDVAGNVAHEWCHKMGFDHEYRYNSLRQHTVPYAVGYFVQHFKKDLTVAEIRAKMGI